MLFFKIKILSEYHTNLDNFKVVTAKGLQQSFDIFKEIIDAFEKGLYQKTKINCEPNLGKEIYTQSISKGNYNKEIENRMNLLGILKWKMICLKYQIYLI